MKNGRDKQECFEKQKNDKQAGKEGGYQILTLSHRENKNWDTNT